VVQFVQGVHTNECTASLGRLSYDVVRMFDGYRSEVIELRRAGQRLADCVQTLEETDLESDHGVARWLQELADAEAAGGEAVRRAGALRAALADAWPRPIGTDELDGRVMSAGGRGACSCRRTKAVTFAAVAVPSSARCAG